ncbi:MAG: hypothetical protein HYX37_05470 [Rhizobiales bacterium]|nr:hypothetical protein [Hyphomicrobiales bacterium]
MARFYVEISGVSQEFLDFLGYFLVYEDRNYKLLKNKDEYYLLEKKGKQYLYVDDKNDADLLTGAFIARHKIDAPDPNTALDEPEGGIPDEPEDEKK